MKRTIKSKLFGIRFIDYWHLPHPDWRIFDNSNIEITEPWTDAFCGWTVRTAFNRNYATPGEENNLPFLNKLNWNDIPNVIREISKRFTEPFVFIIYPSWEFKVSGTVLHIDNHITIEAVRGSIGKLTSGNAIPEGIITFFDFAPYLKTSSFGDLTIVRKGDRNIFRGYFEIFCLYKSILEWTRTKNNELFFHQWDIFE